MRTAYPISWEAGFREAWATIRGLATDWTSDPTFAGDCIASVPFRMGGLGSGVENARGDLSLLRLRDGRHRLGVEVPQTIFHGLGSTLRRRAYTLDDVVDVRGEPGFWGGALIVTPMEVGALRDLPGAPREAFGARTAQADRGAAEAFACAVGLADLPA